MSRRMVDPQFRADQLDGIRDPQVAAVNALCDLLTEERGAEPDAQRVPYIAPHYDARSASVLLLLSNPGPKAGGDAGSGMLSWENDDASAARMFQVCEQVGLSGSDAFPWNAYPWHVHEKYPNGLPKELVVAGLDALARLLQVAPNIRAIIAHGGDARRSVRLLAKDVHTRDFVEDRGIRFFETRHTSNRAFIAPAVERERMLRAMCDVYRDAVRSVGLEPRLASAVNEQVSADADDRWLRTVLADPRMAAHLHSLAEVHRLELDQALGLRSS